MPEDNEIFRWVLSRPCLGCSQYNTCTGDCSAYISWKNREPTKPINSNEGE